MDLAQLKQELKEELLKEMCSVKAMQVQPTHYTTVFSEAVMVALFPKNFKMPNIPPYNGRGDCTAHVEVFRSWMDFERVSELARCLAFLLTLMG